MKKIWLTTLAIGAFAVPVGVVSAQTGDDVVDDTTTTQECDGDQIRQQLRLHDGSGDETREQRRAHQGEAVGEAVRDRDQDRTGECDGCDVDHVREHQHDRNGDGDHVREHQHDRNGDGDRAHQAGRGH